MKFRPQMQLRFRSPEQYIAIKSLAVDSQVSVNEWLLLKIEESHPKLRDANVESPSLDEVKESKKSPKLKCPTCESKDVVPWGAGQHCNACKRNF